MNANRPETYSLFMFLKLLYTWRKYLLGVGLAAAVLSSIVALLLPEYYKSTAVLIPYHSKRIDLTTLFLDNPDYDIFGSKRDLDRVLSVANSDVVAMHVIHKFNLYEHYKIDSTQTRYHRTEVLKEFMDNLKIVKTEKDAIEISLLDTDKKLAAEVVNEMVRKIDEINRLSVSESIKMRGEVLRSSLLAKRNDINQMRDSLTRLKVRYRVQNPEKEAEILSKSLTETREMLTEALGRFEILRQYRGENDSVIFMLRARIKGLQDRYLTLTKRTDEPNLNLEDFSAGSDQVSELMNILEEKQKELAETEVKLQRAMSAAEGKIPSVYLLESAVPAERKSKPIRWLIVVGSSAAAVFLALFFRLLVLWYQREAAAEANAIANRA